MSVLAEERPDCETGINGEKYCQCNIIFIDPDGFFGDDDDDEGQSGHDELKKRGKTAGGGDGDGDGDEEGDGDGGDGDDGEKRRRVRRANGIIGNMCKILVHYDLNFVKFECK
jgi:hypothetical protein